uniref:SMC hinge domain-containing protein n=1 Tax=Tetranychus urticae TaxID=32264 RepID=T1KX20_TETUR
MNRGDDGEAAATLADQLMQTKREIANLDTETAKAKMKVKHCKDELVKKESEASKKKGNYENDVKLVERMENEAARLKRDLDAIGFDEQSSESMMSERENLRKEYDQLRYDVNSLENKLPQIHFNYRKPTPDFDHSRVKGPVCTLFKVKDPRNYTALEVAASGRLYNIIVADEETAKLILEKGRPEKRCTLLPLDKIRGREIDPRVLKNAQSIVGRDNVFPALDLIEFDPSLTEAMKYVFGDTMICPNMDCAKKVTFARNVATRTVTLDGEVFDPSGTLTGGAIGGKGAVLSSIDQLMKRKSTFSRVKSTLMEIERKLDSMHASKQQYTQLKQQYDLRSHEIELLKDRLKSTNQHLLLEEIENLKQTIAENEQSLQDMVDRKKTAEKKVKELESKMKNTASIRERELQEAEKALEKAKKNFEKTKKAASEREQAVSFLKMEIDELKKSLDNYAQQLTEVDSKIEAQKAEVDEASKAVDEAKEVVDGVQEEIKKLKRLINEHSSEIARLTKQKENLVREAEEMKLSIKKHQHEISQIENEGKDASKSIQQLLKKFTWINEEKHLFGEESAGYGFKRADFNPEELEDRIKRLQDDKNKLSKTVNMRANIMLGDKEKEAEELNKKRQIIENDKKKLLVYMEDVDKKKKDALKDAWEKINKDFGNIFTTLLPGANAKLMPPEGKTIMEGLEVKVAFGDVWKESLTELSGGQRSLVALSLILALLLYNPAPIYILDEVDAALDQSHTTNIGTMIKKHFTNSQFIIVSLKDDMFNNANVLFRTKFVDGCSTVTRFAKGDR